MCDDYGDDKAVTVFVCVRFTIVTGVDGIIYSEMARQKSGA